MNTETLATIRNRKSFRPFSIRANSGAVYTFERPEPFGATGNLQVLIHFGEHRFSIIDADSITEVIEDTPPKG